MLREQEVFEQEVFEKKTFEPRKKRREEKIEK